MSTEIIVSSLSQLQNALANAKGGETIRLQDGYYGSLSITKDFESKVTIEAINPQKASFEVIDIKGGSNIHLDSLVINDYPRLQNVENITITNNDFKNGLFIRFADQIVVDNNDIGGAHHALTMDNITNFSITGNYIYDAREDLVRITGDSKFGLFENNTLDDIAAVPPAHPDMVQMFGTDYGTPSNITFRGNHLYDDPSTGSVHAQGFFFKDARDGGYKNIVVEDNLVNVGSPNSIYIEGGEENVLVQNNTLIPWPGGGGAVIRLANNTGQWDNSGTTVKNNVTQLILNETNVSNVYDNYVYGKGTDINKLFSGDGDVWQDFIPVEGSPIDLSTGLGAANRLNDLISGTSSSGGGTAPSEPDAPAPTPDPDTSTPDSSSGEVTQPDPGGDQGQVTVPTEGVAYSLEGAHEFNRNSSDVIEVAHIDSLALDAATISFTFNADTVSGKHGLFSKDASYYEGGGHHLVAYIEKGVLVVRFQDGSGDEIARIDGIKANTDYDLQLSFGEGNVSVWLDGQKMHSADFSTEWTTNVEYMQIGARGWASKSGEAGFSDVFDGTISDVYIAEGNLNPAQMENLLAGEPDTTDPEPDAPTPDFPPESAEAIYKQLEEVEFNGRTNSIVNLDHDASYELDEGTIAFTFNADDLHGRQGLISKDASYYEGGGNHITAMLNRDQLIFRFQDEDSDLIFTVDNIEAGEDYDVQTWFGDGEVGLAVNGEVIGVEEFDLDLNANQQNLQFGGLGWSSVDGGDRVSNAFDGTMSNMVILDEALPVDTGDLFI